MFLFGRIELERLSFKKLALPRYGGICPSVPWSTPVALEGTAKAFVKVGTDGRTACWGDADRGGTCPNDTSLAVAEEVQCLVRRRPQR